MPSLQKQIMDYIVRTQTFIGGDKIQPLAIRERVEMLSSKSKPHEGVKVESVDLDSVPGEWLIPNAAPPDQALLYIHGGGWFMGSINTHRSFVSTLAYKSGIRTLSFNYRLAPEDPFPAGLEDCITAYEWLLHSGISSDNIVVAGDSAGGNLALALLTSLRYSRKPFPVCAVCLSPSTDLSGNGLPDKIQTRSDPYFDGMFADAIIPGYIGDHDPRNPLISPIYSDLKGFPPMLICVGEQAFQFDDAVRFSKRATDAGVEAETVEWNQMFHIFPTFTSNLPEAKRAVDQIALYIDLKLGAR